MLVLTRRIGENLVIGKEVSISVLSVRGSDVRLGIVAPADVAVHREEVLERFQQEKRTPRTQLPRRDGVITR